MPEHFLGKKAMDEIPFEHINLFAHLSLTRTSFRARNPGTQGGLYPAIVKHHPLKRVASEFCVNGPACDGAYTHSLGVDSGTSYPS